MTTEKCRVCGAPLDRSSGASLCPACMLRDVLATAGGEAQAREGAASLPPLPRRFGSYELLREIGRGGMGVVYAARQPALNRTVAVKLLLSGAHASETALRRFHTEAKAAAGLQHPNIVEIHDYGEVDGQPFYAMDLVEGQNLGELSAGHPLPVERAAMILRELAHAVHCAHHHGVLHRDLKPSNVLIDRDGRPRITDFGLARRLDDANGVTQTGEMLGSPSFTAPEQAAGRPQDIGVATDVYGLGALFYHLLTGRAPFNAATPSGTLRLVLEADPPPPRLLNPALPRDLETICLKCLAKEPARRYATAAEVGEDIERFLDNRPIRARPPSTVYRARRFARRYRTGVVAVAAVFAALTAGLTLALVGYRRAVEQQRAANAARARSQEMVNFIMQKSLPNQLKLGRRKAVIESAEMAVQYFEQLPARLRTRETIRAHATALDFLVQAYGDTWWRLTSSNPEGARIAVGKAAALWRELAESDPTDVDAMATALFDEYLTVVDDPKRFPSRLKATEDGLLSQYRVLEGRFPKNESVQIGLVRLLPMRAYNLSGLRSPAETVAAGREGRQRIERLLAKKPGDAELLWYHAWECDALSSALSYSGDRDAAVQCQEEGLASAEELLKMDPANVQSLEVAANLALGLMFREPAQNRKAERVRIVRHYLSTLMSLDPDDPEWRYMDAFALAQEAWDCFADGRPREAQKAMSLAVERWESLPRVSDYRWRIANAVALAGTFAGFAEEKAVAAAMRDRLRREFMGWVEDSDTAEERARRRYHWLYCQSIIVRAMQDWTDLEGLARGMLVEAERHRIEAPDTTLLDRLDRAGAQSMLGEALLKQGRAAEAVPILEDAVARFRDNPNMAWFTGHVFPGRWRTAENLARALQPTGNQEHIVGLLEWAFAGRDAQVKAGGRLLSRIELAQTAWLLARALDTRDPAQAARRREVLARARELLDDPETGPRLEPAERDLRAQIGAALAEDT